MNDGSVVFLDSEEKAKKYVGDIEEKEVKLPDLHKAYYKYLNENLNPKIVRTFPEL